MMQNPENSQPGLSKPRSAQIPKHLPFVGLGVLSWLGFSYLLTLYISVFQSGSLESFSWSVDAPLWNFAFSLVGAGLIILAKRKFNLLSENSKSVARDFLLLACLIPAVAVLLNGFSIHVMGLTYSGNKKTIEFDWLMGFLHILFLEIFVGFTCIGYFYLTLINKTKERLAQAQQAKSEMELKTLQQKVDPHFLFNNLNVLSSLIEKDPENANEFLDKLAQLYRYILHTKDAEVVSVKEELDFAQNYLYLLQKRFGDAYYFDWQIPEAEINGQMIVPTALQSLLENVVKHNAGSRENPLPVCVKLDLQTLVVENEICPKTQNAFPSGTGLENLRARYLLLTENSFEVLKSENLFVVKIPLLEIKK
jgi:hypothetical protein